MVVIKKSIVVECANTITKGIVNQLKSEGHCARRVNSTGIWDEKKKIWRRQSEENTGISDIIACIKPKGWFFGIEVKFDKDKQSPAQKRFQKEVKEAGGTYLQIKTWEQWNRWWDNYKELNYL